jgi:hypothetical protein
MEGEEMLMRLDLDVGRALHLALGGLALLLCLSVDAVFNGLLGTSVRSGSLGDGHALLVCPVLVIGPEHEVPPAERRAVVVDERHVVEVVVVGTGPEWDDVLE